jgi:hypothetical protein
MDTCAKPTALELAELVVVSGATLLSTETVTADHVAQVEAACTYRACPPSLRLTTVPTANEGEVSVYSSDTPIILLTEIDICLPS